MAEPLVLFVPGYPEFGTPAQLAHRFAHMLAVVGLGKGVVLPDGAYDALALGGHVPVAKYPGASPLEKPVDADEAAFLDEVKESLAMSGGLSESPRQRALLHTFVVHYTDPRTGAVRALFEFLRLYGSDQKLRYGVQDALKDQLVAYRGRRILIVAHGLGSMFVHDTLFKLGPAAPSLDFVTVGSPLGLRAVQRRLKCKAGPDGKLAVPERIQSWTNLVGDGDVMNAPLGLSDRFRWADDGRRIFDLPVSVDTGWPHHRWEGYARGDGLRRVVAGFLARR